MINIKITVDDVKSSLDIEEEDVKKKEVAILIMRLEKIKQDYLLEFDDDISIIEE